MERIYRDIFMAALKQSRYSFDFINLKFRLFTSLYSLHEKKLLELNQRAIYLNNKQVSYIRN